MRMGRTDSRTRMLLVLLAFAVVATAASVRLGQWQIVEAGELSTRMRTAIAQSRAAANRIIRADIVDRRGKVLAKTSTFDRLVAYPNTMDPAEVGPMVELLGALLDLKPYEQARWLKTLEQAVAAEDMYLVLSPGITPDQSEAILDAKEEDLIDGIGLEAREIRRYPRKGGQPGTTLASPIIGFVRGDGRGGSGIESYFNERLTTPDPERVELATIDGTAISLAGLDLEPLPLAIDFKLQRQVEKELYAAYEANQAKSVSAIVMDPETGAILAAASIPAYDAEDYAAIADRNMSRLRNRVYQDQYEPGSVMKIFTVTAALDMDAVTPNTIIRDQVALRYWEDTVHNANMGSEGALKVKDVIAKSRNVATAKIAKRLGSTVQKAGRRLYGLWERVGLVGRTGAGVVGEAYGNPYDPAEKRWAAVELANRSFGQGSSFTLPQLARGLSTLVNGGYRVQPYLVQDSEQAQVKRERVLKTKTARQAKDILRYVTGSRYVYAKGALIPGYDIGGKTGTAQIWNVSKGKWKEERFNHSFIGFVGGRKQEYVIAVRLEEPVPIYVKQGQIPLHVESYQLFRRLALATIENLDMKRSRRPGAGLPIVRTEAARLLTPVRNREIQKQKKQDAAKAKKAKKAQKAQKAQKAKRKHGGPDLAADTATGQSDRGHP